MSVWKRILLLLAIFLLVLMVVCIPLLSQIPLWLTTISNNWTGEPYQMAVLGSDDMVCAARIDPEGKLDLRLFQSTGKQSPTKWNVDLPQEAAQGDLDMLFLAESDCVYFSVYEEDSRYLSLYRAQEGQRVERLLRETCTGSSILARQNSLSFSTAIRQQDSINLTLLTDQVIRLYTYSPENGLQVIKELDRESNQQKTLSAVGISNNIYRGDGAEMLLTFVGNGIYYLDGKDMSVHYADLSAETHNIDLLKLASYIGDHQVTSLSLGANGNALLLLDGHSLQLVTENGVQDLSSKLFPSRTACILRVCALSTGALILSLVIWWLMARRSRSRVPLALYWGVVCLATFCLAATVAYYLLFWPTNEDTALRERNTLTNSVVNLALTEHSLQDPFTPDLVSRSLAEAGESMSHGLRVVPVKQESGEWYLSSGIRAELDPGVHKDYLRQAASTGMASGKDGGRFWYCIVQGNDGLFVSSPWTDSVSSVSQTEKAFLLGTSILAAAMVFILAVIDRDVRKTAKGLERFAGDQKWQRLRVSGGDELEGMASTLNSMAAERREEKRRRERIAASYRRFVPEQILKLLGKTTVLDVDKSTLVSRNMAVMQIAFSFPAPVYSNEANTRLLFDSVNQVIERTASIVRQKGGAVFNFAYDGYDVVMERDPEQVVSAAVAVQQEILSLNEQRAQDTLPTVTLRIALDIGDVIMGIIGDQDQIEPSTLSDSFVTMKELIDICDKVDANILCTEAIASGISGYGSRYMGRCAAGTRSVRVYEVFDGDPYEMRKGKEANVRRFSEGVLSLYSGEIAYAKRVFLDLVRDAPRDGGARYYLYLADRLTEEDTENGVSLNGRMEMDDDRT